MARPLSTEEQPMTGLADEVSRSLEIETLLEDWGGGELTDGVGPPGTRTYVVPSAAGNAPGRRREPLTVRVPTGADAAAAVQHEARMLVELRRRRCGDIERTIPRHVGVHHLGGLPVTLASMVPGRPMSVGYDRRLHVARPDLVRRDFQQASTWLSRFQEASGAYLSPTTWVAEVAAALRSRAPGHPLVETGVERLRLAAAALDGPPLVRTAVHGDFWHGNLLVHESEIRGVVNWTCGSAEGWPLRDLVRFALRYSQHLDQHTRPGRRVAGHPALRRVGAAPGIRYGLLGRGWYPRTVQAYLQDGLERLGVQPSHWYLAALVGIAELAAEHREERAVVELLTLLADLPAHVVPPLP
jgi:hypothetical protein